jgi:hypothetical protein
MISFMDFENAAVALVDDDQKDAVHALLDALVDCYIDIFTRSYNAYPFESLNFHDDWGSQRAPFFSLDVAMEMLVPHMKRVTDFCHNDLGVKFDLHSCGKNELLVPAYIAAGIDSWSGQPMNDKPGIYDAMNGEFILGMDIKLPDGLPQPTTTMPLEDAKVIGKQFLDTYLPNYLAKPITGGNWAAPDGYLDFIYEESRKMFYDMAK